MFKYIRSVRVEHAVRISSVTTLYIDNWNLFENLRHARRQTDRQTDRFATTKTETQFYKLIIVIALEEMNVFERCAKLQWESVRVTREQSAPAQTAPQQAEFGSDWASACYSSYVYYSWSYWAEIWDIRSS